MIIKYKIIEAYPEEHLIVVRYYTDFLTEEMLASDVLDGKIRRCRTDVSLNVPIPTPDEKGLHEFISSYAPVHFFQLKELTMKNDPSIEMGYITGLLDKEFVHDTDSVEKDELPFTQL
jgi:hypothetical protein